MVIAFWNIDKNTEIGDTLIDFVKEKDIDILFLAETEKKTKNDKRNCKNDDILLDFIIKSKKNLKKEYFIIPNNDFRVKTISNYPIEYFSKKDYLFKSSRWSALNLKIPNIIELNIFPVHFYSKINWSENSLALECVNFSRDIQIVEEKTNCTNSILIGDFNMSPFENGIVASNGLNALQDVEYLLENQKGREIDGTFYKYFYNPMWNFLGDNLSPYGTMYHRVSGHISHEWHLYDQILLRPQLRKHFNKKSFNIVTKIKGQSLLKKNNRPDEVNYSDHLPIIVELKI